MPKLMRAMRVSEIVRATAAAAAIALHPATPCVADSTPGFAIFEAKCAACHAGGGNVLNGGKNLKLDVLQKNGYGEQDAIVQLLRNGKGQMPKYQGAIPPVSKLTDEELEAVAQFVLEQAKAGWVA